MSLKKAVNAVKNMAQGFGSIGQGAAIGWSDPRAQLGQNAQMQANNGIQQAIGGAPYHIYAGGGGGGSGLANSAAISQAQYMAHQAQMQAKMETDLNRELESLNEGAWAVPVSQLIDLWTVKYGSKWVQQSELDEFYWIAAKRLIQLNKIEQHNLASVSLPVLRIVE